MFKSDVIMKTKVIHRLGSFIGLFLFSAALWVLYHELRIYSVTEILGKLSELPLNHLCLATVLTSLSYLVMTGYDVLALRYIKHPLSYTKTVFASFTGYALSNNIGLSMIAGATVRYRLYSTWGLSTFEITKTVVFCTLTLWLGFFFASGIIFLFEPLLLPGSFHLPFASARPLGVILLLVIAAYLLLCGLKKRPFTVHEWEFPTPSFLTAIVQVAISSIDWILASSVLYVLLPNFPLSFTGFIGIYMLAQLAGLISQVPGGLGVFETVILLFLSPHMPAPNIIGSLLAFRVIYYLIPLGLATILLGIQEFLQKRKAVFRFARTFGQRIYGIVPYAMSYTVFISGALLLFSGATPPINWRLKFLNEFIPLPVLEISHFMGSVIGIALMLLARGLQHRIDAAYVFTISLLTCGIAFTLLKGFDYDEAVILFLILCALIPCRRHFYRKASFFSLQNDPGSIIPIIIVLICSVALGLFSYKHVEYSSDLWWRFTLSGDAPRFLRASVGAAGVIFFWGLIKILSPASPKLSPAHKTDLDKVNKIVQNSGESYANLAFLGDKSFLFSQKGNAFIMYGIEGRSWIGMGDPVGEEAEWAELLWDFRELCDRYDGRTVFYEVGPEKLFLYLDLGLTMLKLGEEGRIFLDEFTLEGSSRKRLRYISRKLEKQGCSFELVEKEAVPPLLTEFKNISDAWLESKNTREKKFSLGFFDNDYLMHFPVGVVRKDGRIVAFTNLWSGTEKKEISVDLMRYLPDAPDGVMDFLFIHLMLWGKQEGFRWFNLGMAPMSGIEEHALASLWNRIGAFVFKHGEHFYNLQGLRQYKEKFGPVWRPKYLVTPGGMALPRILTNIASLISGGVKGIIAK